MHVCTYIPPPPPHTHVCVYHYITNFFAFSSYAYAGLCSDRAQEAAQSSLRVKNTRQTSQRTETEQCQVSKHLLSELVDVCILLDRAPSAYI